VLSSLDNLKRNEETGLLLPDYLAAALEIQQHTRLDKKTRHHHYGFYCKHCGYSESCATKEEVTLEKKLHKLHGCQWMIAVDQTTGARRMIRKQLYLYRKNEARKAFYETR